MLEKTLAKLNKVGSFDVKTLETVSDDQKQNAQNSDKQCKDCDCIEPD